MSERARLRVGKRVGFFVVLGVALCALSVDAVAKSPPVALGEVQNRAAKGDVRIDRTLRTAVEHELRSLDLSNVQQGERYVLSATLTKMDVKAKDRTAVPGVATGLAVTGAGGDVLFIEATSMDGEPGLTLAERVPEPGPPGLVVVNPPYGERLGAEGGLEALYAELGATLKGCFPGWRAAVLTGAPDLAHHLGLRADRRQTLYNGALECRLLHFAIAPAGERPRKARPPLAAGPGTP